MDFSRTCMYNIKVTSSLEEMREYLVCCDFQKKYSFYMLDIYMVKDTMDILTIKSLEELTEYCVIEDINNINKTIFLVDDKCMSKSNISSTMASKAMMEAFHYQELMHLNYQIDVYESHEMKIYLKEILGQGIYFDIEENNKYNTEEKLLTYLKANKFQLDYTDIHINNVETELKTIQERIQKQNRKK